MKIFRKVKGIEEPEGDNYDALILDIDGTLVNSQKVVSEATRDAIIEAQKRGKTVAIASGRSISGIRRTASSISLEEFGGYVIAYNGTTVVNCKTGECIYNQMISTEMIAPVYEAAKEAKVGILVYHDQQKELLSGNGVDKYIEADARACEITIRETKHFVQDINFPINKFLLTGEPEYMCEVEKKMQEKFGDRLNVFRSDPYYVELLPKFVDKGVAVEKLMKHLDIKKDKVICIGDSYNDLPMLRRVGLGVAMGNAQKEVKEAADFITDSNDEDGIVKVIKKFMTEKKEETE